MIVTILLLAMLVVISMVDIATKTIKDGITLTGLLVALNVQLFYGDIKTAVIGMTVGVLFMWILNLIKAQTVGGGDVKLMALLGACVGWGACVGIALVALGGFKVYKTINQPEGSVAYAPFITFGFIMVNLCQMLM